MKVRFLKPHLPASWIDEKKTKVGYETSFTNMNLKPYPKYKDSGIEWIGEIPMHWDVKKTKIYSYCKYGTVARFG